MTLNPFFLHGTNNEQSLVQGIINEQLRMFGVEVLYIPRKFVRKETILKEVSSSKFNQAFSIEAYLDNYDGYTGQGDLLTKFGVSLKDEVNLIISRERFETFISEFLKANDPFEVEISFRPREGDLVYFPLGKRLFEVKFVEHESPFYQLGKLYVYQLKCELFEYEDEILDTSIDEVDSVVKDEGYITTINLIANGVQATASANIDTGYIRKIILNNDGYGYVTNPTVEITPAPTGGTNATAIALKGNSSSIKEIILTHAGIGYTEPPTITIIGGGGLGATASCIFEKNEKGVVSFNITNMGDGYATTPTVSIIGNVGAGETAVGIASLSEDGRISSIKISNSGIGYTQPPTVIIGPPSIINGTGTYQFNEIVVGSQSGTKARVKSWNATEKVLKVAYLDINNSSLGFYPGETIVGSISSSSYAVAMYDLWDNDDKYGDNFSIQYESEQILDFSEENPFGSY